MHSVGWWCTPAAVVLAARWAATVVILAVGSTVAVGEVVLAMVPCASAMVILVASLVLVMVPHAAVMVIVVAAPRLVGVMWSTIG